MFNSECLETTPVDTLTSWLIGWMAREFKVGPEAIEPGQAFLSYGMDSVQAMTLVGDLESELNLRLPPTLVWDYPIISELAGHLAGQLGASSPTARTGSGLANESGLKGTDAKLESPRPAEVSGNIFKRLLQSFK
jgi:acyl carrier protein